MAKDYWTEIVQFAMEHQEVQDFSLDSSILDAAAEKKDTNGTGKAPEIFDNGASSTLPVFPVENNESHLV